MSPDAIALRPGAPIERIAFAGGSLLAWQAAGRRGGPALLCLHGAACGAWVWADGFGAQLAASGYPAAAFTFTRRAGRSLGDFRAEALAALDALDTPTVLVAHSLGALVAQRLLADPRVLGAVLLAPAAPEGLWLSNTRLALTDPALWRDAASMTRADTTAPAERLAAALFGPAMMLERACRHLRHLRAESARALIEAQLPQPVLPAFLLGKPVLVLGAGEDRLIDADTVRRCAAWHGTAATMLAGRGHLLMLDAGWQEVAARIAGWVGARFA